MVSSLRTFAAFITVPVWGAMEVGVTEVGAMEVGAIEVGEMEVGAMEVKVVEVCWRSKWWRCAGTSNYGKADDLVSSRLCSSCRCHSFVSLRQALDALTSPIPSSSSTRSPR